MASTRRPRDSQTSWPVPISVATATKRLARLSMVHGLQVCLEDVAQPLAGDQAGAREIEVEKAQNLAPRQLAREAARARPARRPRSSRRRRRQSRCRPRCRGRCPLRSARAGRRCGPSRGRIRRQAPNRSCSRHLPDPVRAPRMHRRRQRKESAARCLRPCINSSAEGLSVRYARVNGGLRGVPAPAAACSRNPAHRHTNRERNG